MHNRYFIFLVIGLLPVVSSECPNDCSGHGYCRSTQCSCHFGYFEKDCSASVMDHNANGVAAIQAIFSIIFVTLLCINITGLYTTIKHNGQNSFWSNMQSLCFGSLGFASLTHLLFNMIDPFWVRDVIPYPANMFLFYIGYPVEMIAYIAILFHWVEVINISLTSIKKEKMLQQINKNYQGKEIYLEDVASQARSLKKLRLPFVVVVLIVLFGVSSMQLTGTSLLINTLVVATYGTISVGWLCLAIGFVFYGRKMISLIPYQIVGRAKQLTRKLTLVSIFLTLIIIIMLGVNFFVQRKNAASCFAVYSVIEMVQVCFVIGELSAVVYRRSSFPYFGFSEQDQDVTTQGSNSGSGQSSSQEFQLQDSNSME